MSSNQINCVEKYAWVDEALENAWNQAHFEEEDEELNQETFGPAEASVAYIPIPMEIDDENSVSTISLGEEDVDDYEYDDFSVADAAEEEEDEGEHYEYAAAAGDAYGYAAPVEEYNEDEAYDEEPDEDAMDVVWDVPIWYRQTTHWVLNDGTVIYNGHEDGQRVHNAAQELPLLVVHEPDDAMDVV